VKAPPHSYLLPLLESTVRGRRRAAKLVGQVPPCDPGDEHEQDGAEHHSVINSRATTTGIRAMLWQERLDHTPQLVANLPNRLRHRPPPHPGYVNASKIRCLTPRPFGGGYETAS
jgi:hypothetical protein